MLTVLVLITILTAVAAPALLSISNSAGRKAGVNTLLNAFEQARVAALTSGTNTYVGFADMDFPVESMRYRAFIIFRSAAPDEVLNTEYVALSRWEMLPKNISLKSEPSSLVGAYRLTLSDSSIPRLSSGDSMPCLVFNSSGAITQPAAAANLQVFLYEGYFAGGQDNFVRKAQSGSAALFERISFSRFTGRAQLDITNL